MAYMYYIGAIYAFYIGKCAEGAKISPNPLYFVLERCLLLAHKRSTIQTTNAIKDVANEGHISPDVMGGWILAQKLENAIPLLIIEAIYTILRMVSK